MTFPIRGLAVISLAAVLATGCNSTRLSSMDTQPAPLPAAPAGTMTGNTLPPPAAPAPADPAKFPTAPANQQVAALPADGGASAPDLTSSSVVGAWKTSVSGQSCQMMASLTKYGSNNRAAPLRCAAPLDGVKSWNVSGKQLSLYDESGSVVARLYGSGPEKFDGQTSTGMPISLSR